MPVRVVDASAICAVLFGEPEAARIAGRLDGVELAAPSLLPFEVANVCLTKIRRQPREQNQLMQAFALFAHMKIDLMAVDVEATLAMARQSNLTVYDASYLWLATSLGGGLVTLDKQLDHAFASLRAR